MKIRYLRAQVLEQLRQDIEKHLPLYRSGDFGHLLRDSALYFEGASEIDVERLTKIALPADGNAFEAENSRLLYEAVSNLTPYEARDERLWTYLTHTYLLPYARQRWPIPTDNEDAIKHIQVHFFARDKRGVDRDNAASRLWWMAYLCSCVPHIDLGTALETLLYRSDVRANIIERPSISQNRLIFAALLRALHSSYDGDKALFERAHFRALMMRVNSIGGFKLLEYMPEGQVSALVDSLVAAAKPQEKTTDKAGKSAPSSGKATTIRTGDELQQAGAKARSPATKPKPAGVIKRALQRLSSTRTPRQ